MTAREPRHDPYPASPLTAGLLPDHPGSAYERRGDGLVEIRPVGASVNRSDLCPRSVTPTQRLASAALSASLSTTGRKRAEKGRNRRNRPEMLSAQVITCKDVPIIRFQRVATCKVAKLSFVAGAEIPKRYVVE
jgi:hypothetical protein